MALPESSLRFGQAVHEFQIGDTIDGRWRVFGSAAGGCGQVWFVTDSYLNDKRLAVKSFNPPNVAHSAVPNFEQIFFNECRIWMSLPPSPRLVTAFYVIGIADRPRLFMEYVPGGTLRNHLQGLALATSRALEIAIQVATGLEKVHEQGIVHRDLKPENCLLTESGRIKITDFGLGRSGLGHASVHGPICGAVGSPAYMGPECWQPGTAVEPASDVYAFGVMLFEMLIGQRPIIPNPSWLAVREPRMSVELKQELAACSGVLQVMRVLHELMPPPLDLLYGRAPDAVQQLVFGCLAKSPADRPSISDAKRILSDCYFGGLDKFDQRQPDLRLTFAGRMNRVISEATIGNVEHVREKLETIAHDCPSLPHSLANAWITRIVHEGAEPAQVPVDVIQRLRSSPHADLSEFAAKVQSEQLHHDGAVQCLAVSPDGRFVGTVSERVVPGKFRPLYLDITSVWSLASRKIEWRHRGIAAETPALPTITFTRDGSAMVTSRQRTLYHVWQIASGTTQFSAFDVSTGGTYTPCHDTVVARPGTNHLLFLEQTDLVLRTDARGTVLAKLADGRPAHMPDMGRVISRLVGHSSKVVLADFDSTGAYIVSADTTGCCRIWSLPSERCVGIFRAGGILAIGVLGSGHAVIHGTDRQVTILKLEGAYQVARFTADRVVLSDDRNLIALFCDGISHVIDTRSMKTVSMLSGELIQLPSRADAALVSRCGRLVVISLDDEELRSPVDATLGALTPDGRHLIVVDGKMPSTIQVLSGRNIVRTHREWPLLPAPTETADEQHLADDEILNSTHALGAGDVQALQVLEDVAARRPEVRLNRAVADLMFSVGRAHLPPAEIIGAHELWSVRYPGAKVMMAEIAPDQASVMVRNQDSVVEVRSLRDGILVDRSQDSLAGVSRWMNQGVSIDAEDVRIALSPDGRRSVQLDFVDFERAGSAVRVVDTQTGATVTSLGGATDVTNAAFSPDGRLIFGISPGKWTNLNAWDAQTGELVCRGDMVYKELSVVRDIRTLDGRTVFVNCGRGSQQGTIFGWEIESGRISHSIGNFVGIPAFDLFLDDFLVIGGDSQVDICWWDGKRALRLASEGTPIVSVVCSKIKPLIVVARPDHVQCLELEIVWQTVDQALNSVAWLLDNVDQLGTAEIVYLADIVTPHQPVAPRPQSEVSDLWLNALRILVRVLPALRGDAIRRCESVLEQVCSRYCTVTRPIPKGWRTSGLAADPAYRAGLADPRVSERVRTTFGRIQPT